MQFEAMFDRKHKIHLRAPFGRPSTSLAIGARSLRKRRYGFVHVRPGSHHDVIILNDSARRSSPHDGPLSVQWCNFQRTRCSSTVSMFAMLFYVCVFSANAEHVFISTESFACASFRAIEALPFLGHRSSDCAETGLKAGRTILLLPGCCW